MREGSPEPTRPVWLTEAQAEWRGLIPQWSAAPENATEAVAEAIRNEITGLDDEDAWYAAEAALRALGDPAALGGSQETPTC